MTCRSSPWLSERRDGAIEHRRFRDLVEYFAPGDALVLNATRVLRVRLLGTREGSGAPAEIFLLRALGDDRWEAMVQPGAAIFSFDRAPIERVPYEELEHVTGTRDFLNHPGRFLRHLTADES
ncbi:MAG: S-adenosylmethionine:tRNA ribosyltransferase-isomerase [Gemmatimonadaceae bacterium]